MEETTNLILNQLEQTHEILIQQREFLTVFTGLIIALLIVLIFTHALGGE